MMQDRKALPGAGTSPLPRTEFSQSSRDQNSRAKRAQSSTPDHLMGVSHAVDRSLIMTHSDDDGFVSAARLAPIHCRDSTIYKTNSSRGGIGIRRSTSPKKSSPNLCWAPIRVKYDEPLTSAAAEKKWYPRKRASRSVGEAAPKDTPTDSVFCGIPATNPERWNARQQLVATIATKLETLQSKLSPPLSNCGIQPPSTSPAKPEFREFFTTKDEDGIHGGSRIAISPTRIRSNRYEGNSSHDPLASHGENNDEPGTVSSTVGPAEKMAFLPKHTEEEHHPKRSPSPRWNCLPSRNESETRLSISGVAKFSGYRMQLFDDSPLHRIHASVPPLAD